MIHIVDTYHQINSLFENGMFVYEKWERYINSVYPQVASFFIDDLNACLNSGNYVYERDVLPILCAAPDHPALEALHTSFCKITEGLHENVINCFGRELDIDIVLYVGLCNGAGWVTHINGREVILLGIEKILELNWYDEDSMRGLIYHELGHAYHKKYGSFCQQIEDRSRRFIWQLFTEGIAMYFEQVLVRDLRYYHQDKNGWLTWCEEHFQQIASDFSQDLPTMTATDQRYFGDWVRYQGKEDVGYYLGARFIHHLRHKYDLEELIKMNIDGVHQEYLLFIGSIL